MNAVSIPALVFRTASLFIILFQFRLIAADLADTSVFIAALLAAFAAAASLSLLRPEGKQVRSFAAIAVIALVPWVCRLFIAAPRFFMPGRTDSAAIFFDSLLLHFDRNNFVSLFPFYWCAVSTWFSIRYRKFLRAAVIADASMLLVIYSIAQASQIELYRFPIIIIVLFAAVVFFQALCLLFSMPPQTKIRVKEICFAAAALLLIIITGGFLFLTPLQEQAVEMGGGLLEPRLFSFDFSKYLKLDPEISMKNDLILIVKKESDNNILLRRSVHSGYNSRQGFFLIEGLDDKTHPLRLPAGRVNLTPGEFQMSSISFQEYYLINIESTAFIGMKEPSAIIPYESWDASSFNSAYAVESKVSNAVFRDLYRSTVRFQQWPTVSDYGFSENEYKIYTEYGNDERLKSLAEEITRDYNTYADKVTAIY
jgi:hypothetical protein